MHTQEEVVRRISCDITTYWAVPCSIAQYPVVSGSIAQYPVVSSSIDYRAVSHTCHWGGRGDGAVSSSIRKFPAVSEYGCEEIVVSSSIQVGVCPVWYQGVSAGIEWYRSVSGFFT